MPQEDRTVIVSDTTLKIVTAALQTASQSTHANNCPYTTRFVPCTCHVMQASNALAILNAHGSNAVNDILEPLITKRLGQQIAFLAKLQKRAEEYLALHAPDNDTFLASELFELSNEDFPTLLSYFQALAHDSLGSATVNCLNHGNWHSLMRANVYQLANNNVRQTIHLMQEHEVTTYAELLKLLPDDVDATG